MPMGILSGETKSRTSSHHDVWIEKLNTTRKNFSKHGSCQHLLSSSVDSW